MTPALLLLLLFLSTALSQNVTDKGDQSDESLDVSEIIARANAHITSPRLQGDIMVSWSRNASPCTARGCKWPKSGQYVYVPVSFSFSYTETNIIINALISFHRSTCIRFIYRNHRHRNYIHFYSGSGCWSYLGRQSRGQHISLKKNGCLSQSTVQHEVLHALGFHHEQVRSDRDRYVQILFQNIQSGKANNFQKVQTNNLGTPYDFNSIMHYSKCAFSKNGQPTILARSNSNLNFGNARQMSVNDIARVNKLYGCSE
ncbi:low choriolytic enzyme-like [Brachyistius frenatus]|uniref:low choriolytic enzyme-like n=1 Tax=Brachyistius frenatus TaxID=100188 RepID=UPI0037E8E649